ncbi:TPA: cobaltochelatase subunit CobN [Methanopyrus kandleri]|nr:cobaltochelatase subunit CobN [Methanopyrus kandleri]HII70330.1 cobaltochelatase subunit CobN [Methanopyrus kandleri]
MATVLLILSLSMPVTASSQLQFHTPDAGVKPDVYWADFLGYPTGALFREVIMPDSRGEIVTPPTHLGGEPYRQNSEIVQKLVERWEELSEKPNDRKVIALVYYDWPPGRESIRASGLDVFGSLVNILANLKAAGYNVSTPWDDQLLKIVQLERERRWDEAAALVRNLSQELARMIELYGVNVGWWHGDYLRAMYDRHAYLATIPVSEYLKWYDQLPEPVRLYVEYGIPGLLYGYAEPLHRPLEGEALETLSRNLSAMLRDIETLLSNLGVPDTTDAMKALRELADALLRYAAGKAGHDELERAFRRAVDLGRKLEQRYHTGIFGWGPPPGDVMVVDNKFVVPGLKFGNIVLLPQPPRGLLWGMAAYHSLLLPPPHYYLAVYLWLKHHVDVIVHVGAHGTLEWLPLRRTFLSHLDFPTVLLGDVPHVYLWCPTSGELYNVKWRTSAVVLSYLPSAPSTAYDFYLNTLVKLLHSCFHVFEGNPEVEEKLKPVIMELLKRTRVYEWMGLTWEDVERMARTDFNRLVSELHSYLHMMQAHGESPTPVQLTRHLHVYGLVTSEEIREYVSALLFRKYLELVSKTYGGDLESILSPENIEKYGDKALELFDLVWKEWQSLIDHPSELRFRYPELYREMERIRDLVVTSAKLEIENLLRVLDGQSVPVGPPGDPTVDTSVLPTGRMLCLLNPELIPSETAWMLSDGITLKQRTLFVLSAADVLNDRGLSLAVLLRSSGVDRVGERYVLSGSPVYSPVLVCQGLEAIFAQTPAGRALLKAHVEAVLRAPKDLFAVANLLKTLSDECEDPELRESLASIRLDPGLLEKGLVVLRKFSASLGDVDVRPTFRPDSIWYAAWAVKFLYDVQVNGTPIEKAAIRAALGVYCPADYTLGVKAATERLKPEEWEILARSLSAKLENVLTPEGSESAPGLLRIDLLIVDAVLKPVTDRLWGVLAEDAIEFYGGLLAVARLIRAGLPDPLVLDEVSSLCIRQLAGELSREWHSLWMNKDWLLSLRTPGEANDFLERVSRLMAWMILLGPTIVKPTTMAERAIAGVLGQLFFELVQRLVFDREVVEHLEKLNPYVVESIAGRVFVLLDSDFGLQLLRRSYHYQVLCQLGKLEEAEKWARRFRETARRASLETFRRIVSKYGPCGCLAIVLNPVLRGIVEELAPAAELLVPNPFSAGVSPVISTVSNSSVGRSPAVSAARARGSTPKFTSSAAGTTATTTGVRGSPSNRPRRVEPVPGISLSGGSPARSVSVGSTGSAVSAKVLKRQGGSAGSPVPPILRYLVMAAVVGTLVCWLVWMRRASVPIKPTW